MPSFNLRKINNTNRFPYAIEPDDEEAHKLYAEMIRWCYETYEPSKWHRESYCVRFQAEADRNWFLLRWSS